MPLTEIQITKQAPAAKPLKLRDGKGMYLLIQPDGRRWWRWDYRFGGKRKTLSLGVYPTVRLKDARARLEAERAVLAGGVDPGRARKAAKVATSGATFSDVLSDWRASRAHLLAPNTQRKQDQQVARYLTPTIGRMLIAELDGPAILAIIKPLDRHGRHETAHTLKRIIGQVLRYAIAHGTATRDWTHDLRDAIEPVRRHSHAGLTDPDAIGEMLRKIHEPSYGSVPVTIALRLAPLLFARPFELRTMEWAEIDWPAKLWRVPAEKMKKRRPHLVPLSRQSVELLQEIHPITGGGRYVFPGFRSAKSPMSEAAMNRALIRLGYPPDVQTPHGFRRMASTQLNELEFHPDHIEMQLAHAPGGVRAVYNQAKYLTQRAVMMQAYADHLDGLRMKAARV